MGERDGRRKKANWIRVAREMKVSGSIACPEI
jgi:hypothetical protein